MRLIEKVGKVFGFHARNSSQEATAQAVERVRAVGRQADRVTDILQGYLQAEEPFKAFAVDIFERGQESRIHEGNGPPTKS